MSVIQSSRRWPVYGPGGVAYAEHVRQQVRDAFAREVFDALAERGGIVGPIHESERRDVDWLFQTGEETLTFTVYAHLTKLPDPEVYRFIGGPADGQQIRTGGQPVFIIPYMPPRPYSPFDVNYGDRVLNATYERQGDTNVYVFRP